MEYNTVRDKLLLPEYGRNVQKMIHHAMKIEDREERNKAAQAIIKVMGQLNPHLRDTDDYRHKLWAHLFIMSDFQLDVDSPYEIPKKESFMSKPELLKYPKSNIKYGHYGKYTEQILKKAKDLDSEEEKVFLTKVMGNFMKKQYLLHNNTAVENKMIAEQLKKMSENVLEMENFDEELQSTNQLLRELGLNKKHNNNNKKKNNRKNGKNKKKHHR